MSLQNNKTAVLVFIRSEKEEAQLKKFGSCLSFNGNYRIASLLNQRVKEVAKKSGFPTIVVAGNQQKGTTFGQRFTDAVAKVFDSGYENLIAIGNDCLAISPLLLRQAANELSKQKVVLGPTEDGGVYLIGFQKSVFSQIALATLPWQTNQLFDALSLHFQQSTPDICLLNKAVDADDAESLQAVLNQFANHFSFKQILQNLLRSFQNKQTYTLLFRLRLYFNDQFTTRGPPVYSTIS